MKFWQRKDTGQLIRLGEWKKMYETEHKVRFTDTNREYDRLHMFIDRKMNESNGNIIFCGEKY